MYNTYLLSAPENRRFRGGVTTVQFYYSCRSIGISWIPVDMDFQTPYCRQTHITDSLNKSRLRSNQASLFPAVAAQVPITHLSNMTMRRFSTLAQVRLGKYCTTCMKIHHPSLVLCTYVRWHAQTTNTYRCTVL